MLSSRLIPQTIIFTKPITFQQKNQAKACMSSTKITMILTFLNLPTESTIEVNKVSLQTINLDMHIIQMHLSSTTKHNTKKITKLILLKFKSLFIVAVNSVLILESLMDRQLIKLNIKENKLRKVRLSNIMLINPTTSLFMDILHMETHLKDIKLREKDLKLAVMGSTQAKLGDSKVNPVIKMYIYDYFSNLKVFKIRMFVDASSKICHLVLVNVLLVRIIFTFALTNATGNDSSFLLILINNLYNYHEELTPFFEYC